MKGKEGYTLIEVVLAIMVVAVSVASTLLIMSRLMSYTATSGTAFDIANAVAVSQMVVDKVRDQRFPPTGDYGDITTADNTLNGSITISGTTYQYVTKITASDPLVPEKESEIESGTFTESYDSASGDSMLAFRNLLKVRVWVYKGGRLILQTVTYKTRNGYY